MAAELAIVVVSYEVRDLLASCLRSVGEHAGLAHELVVVDNASTDGSAAMVARDFPHAHLIRNDDNRGFARAANQGIAATTAPAVLLLNPDAVLTPGAAPALLARLAADAKLAAVGARLVNPDGSLQRWTAGALPTLGRIASHYLFLDRLRPSGTGAMFLVRDTDEPRRVGWLCGAALLLRRAALDAGGFDESFFLYGEDMELCARLGRAGWGVLYAPEATIVHQHGASMAGLEAEHALAALKGPRAFYRAEHGGGTLWLYDLLTATGFGLRWLLFGLVALLRRRPGDAARARSSRRFFRMAVAVMIGR